MGFQKELNREKEYTSEKAYIKKDILRKISVILCVAFFIFAVNTGFEWNAINISEVFMILFMSVIAFGLFAFNSNAIKNYRVLINDEYIKFKHFIGFLEHDEYKWKDISFVIIGDVVIKNVRFNQTVFGVEIFYKDNYYKKMTSDVHKLDHLMNHEELISEIINKCNEYNIKCEDTRDMMRDKR